MSKSKAIGTRAESLVAAYAQQHGFSDAERLALKGSADHGDVRFCAGFHGEVKGGKMADNAGPQLIADWLDEADKEADNSQSFVLLIVKRKACGAAQVGRWRAIVRLRDLQLTTEEYLCGLAAVEMDLSTALELMRLRGYGDPLEA